MTDRQNWNASPLNTHSYHKLCKVYKLRKQYSAVVESFISTVFAITKTKNQRKNYIFVFHNIGWPWLIVSIFEEQTWKFIHAVMVLKRYAQFVDASLSRIFHQLTPFCLRYDIPFYMCVCGARRAKICYDNEICSF